MGVSLRYALVENERVVNIILANPETAPENAIQSDTAAIGDLWDGETFTRPVVRELVTITKVQAIAAMAQADMLDDFEQHMQNADALTKKLWEASYQLSSDSPLLLNVWAALGKTEKELYDMFLTAVEIKV